MPDLGARGGALWAGPPQAQAAQPRARRTPRGAEDRIRRELADCAARLRNPAEPDREGTKRGAEDWLMEQALIAARGF